MEILLKEPVIPNTALFGDFIKTARAEADLTQESLHDRGGAYRQMQGRIESGDPFELDGNVLIGYDRVYEWPRGYAAAVAQAAAYASGAEQPDPDLFGRTLAALYEPGRDFPALGFDPATGRAVYTDFALLTNVSFSDLLPVVDSRSGATLLDTQLLDGKMLNATFPSDTTGDRRTTFYRLTRSRLPADPFASLSSDGDGRPVTPIALDALTDLTTLDSARRLAGALLELQTARTTVERAAFTFVAVGAFGQDPFTTIRHLQGAGFSALRSGRIYPELNDFSTFWTSFCERHEASADQATPDLEALGLLDELNAARNSAKSIDVGTPTSTEPRLGSGVLPATVRPPMLLSVDGLKHEDLFVFYDSDDAPRIPLFFNS